MKEKFTVVDGNDNQDDITNEAEAPILDETK